MATTPGQILKKAREAKGLTLDQVAAETSIRAHFLQAIEEDRMGAISSQTQMRGFTRLYASYLGLDAATLIDPLPNPQETPAKDTQDKSLGTSQNEPEKKPLISKLLERIEPEAEKRPLLEKILEKIEPEPATEAVVDEIVEKQSTAIFKEIGSELQRQRENLGLSRFDIERQIKIRELYIFALENGRIEDLPSTVQGRGMLNNYAALMNLDPEPLQMRFAEGLQQRRIEQAAEDLARKKSPQLRKFSAPITGWRRYMTPDLLIGSSVFIILFVLVIWGALEVIGSSRLQAEPTAGEVSSILVSTPTATLSSDLFTPASTMSTSSTPTESGLTNSASAAIISTINMASNKPIQVVVVANQRAYLKVVVDGEEAFLGRIAPNDVKPFYGSSKISLSTGNAAALEIYYNQQNLGVLGSNGQVLNLEFTNNGLATSTPQFTTVPTSTQLPTLTQQPTETPTLTATPELPTVTPYLP